MNRNVFLIFFHPHQSVFTPFFLRSPSLEIFFLIIDISTWVTSILDSKAHGAGINHHFPRSPEASLFSENRRRFSLPSSNRHLSAPLFRLYEADPLPPSQEYSNCERQSRENTRLGSFRRASLLRIAGVSMCQHQHHPGRDAILTFG